MKQIIEWVEAIVIAFVIATLMHIFIFVPTRVSGSSMSPTLTDGEFLVVSKISHVLHSTPEYGEIIIIDSRTKEKRSYKDDIVEPLMTYYAIIDPTKAIQNHWVKRVIAKGGDTLQFKEGKVYRNGELLNEPYNREPMKPISTEPFTIPDNSVFVMGDNRNNSTDSRYIGAVPIDHIMGTVKFRVNPPTFF